MKTTLLQRDICWANPEANRQRLEQRLSELPPADLYIFPEMFSTGFCTDPEGIAEENVSEGSLAWMQRIASARGCALAGSVSIKEDGKFYNRFYFVYPDGTYCSYDKHHLFTYGGEHKTFTAGKERVIVTYQGVRILLQICYDLRFPVWSRNRKDYDMVIYVASWPTPRVEVWSALLRARALENQCYVAGVNRVGEDPSCQYSGSTALIDPYGHTLGACKDGEEGEVTADIDMEELERFRQKFPVLDDADAFELM